MKKILLMIGFMVLVILNYGQPTATLRIEGSDITGLVPNDKVYVSLYFDDITAGALVSGWQFFIEYDHSVLTWDGSFSNPNAGISWLNPKFPNTAGGLFFDNLTESELGYLWGDGGTLASVEPVEKIIELKFTYHGGQTPLNWSTSKEEWTIKSMKGSTQLYDENLDNFTLTLINGCACLPNYDITFHVTENGTNMQDALVTVGSQSILTNASGDAVFNLANGIYSYTVTKAGYYDKTGSFTVSGSNLTIQVPMNLLGSEFDVTFQVTSGGNALEGASVEVDGQIIATNVLGEALFSLPNGDYTYTVSKYGYTSESGSFIVDGGTLTIPVSLAMLPHYDIIFHVTSGGNDLEGALVDIPDVESMLTDINGEALFSMVDGDYTYEVSKNGYTTTSGSFTVAGATLVIEVSLEQLFDVTFHVTSGGSDLQGASVTVGTITKFTNANGIAIFSLTNDDYNYVVTKDGYDDETGVFTVAGTNINIEVTMTLITYVVTFHVTSEGNDIEGALVTIDTQSFLTNTNGIAVFNLPDGNYIYSVTKNGYYESNDLFTVEGSNLTIEVELLPYYYDVIFHVTTGGADLEGALVTIGTQSFFTNALGIAMFSLTNGSYNYAVTMAGYDTETGIFTVDNAGMTIEVSMEITVWAITFHVTSAGANLEGALVTIGTQQVTTNASGIALLVYLMVTIHTL